MQTARLARWGNSLAVRLPVAVVRTLDLHEGDEIDFDLDRLGRMVLQRNQQREEILSRLDRYRGLYPQNVAFDRDEAHER